MDDKDNGAENSDQIPPNDTDGLNPDDAPNGQTRLTLEQALLAPLDSILKAQLHSARSFLNLLLQLGYPHKDDGDASNDGHPYSLDFNFTQEGQEQKLSVPALSLVPISPLAVDSANFQLEMSAKRVIKQAQIRESEKNNAEKKGDFDRYQRPWFLVDKPVNIEGDIVAGSNTQAAKSSEAQSAIKININVKAIPLPAGLDKLLTSMSNMSQITPVTPKADSQETTDKLTDKNINEQSSGDKNDTE